MADAYDEAVEYFITNERFASIEKASDPYRIYGNTFTSADRRSIQEFLKLCRAANTRQLSLVDEPD